MARKKKSKGLIGDAMELGKASVGIGVLSDITEKAGGDPAALTKAASFMPSLGTVAGAGAVVKQLKKIKKK